MIKARMTMVMDFTFKPGFKYDISDELMLKILHTEFVEFINTNDEYRVLKDKR